MTATKLDTTPEEAIAFMQEIGADVKDLGVYWGVLCGLHSGYAKCCVYFHAMIFAPLCHGEYSLTAECDRIWDMYTRGEEFTDPRDAVAMFAELVRSGYSHSMSQLNPNSHILCPACALAKKVPPTLDCDCLGNGAKITADYEAALNRLGIAYDPYWR